MREGEIATDHDSLPAHEPPGERQEVPLKPRRLGQTDIEVSPIGLGCWQFSQGKNMTGRMWSVLDQATMDAIVAAALKGGVTWFDTAQAYGGGASERALSAALGHADVAPGSVVVATKWLPILKTAGDIPRTIGTRLECLQPYPIGLFQVHIPWSVSSVRAQMREMAKLVRAGKVRAVGVSNFSASWMAKAGAALQAEGLPLAVNQVRINLLDRAIETNGVLDLARKHRVTLIAYSPLAQGILTGRYHDDPAAIRALPWGRRSRLSPSSRFLTPEGLARSAPLIAALRAVGAAHGASPAQVALAWLVTYYGDTVVAIPGASRPEQAAAAAAAMDLHLSAAEVAEIDAISATVAAR
jgi:aryl-alcohol dehydrogenase-like predicted oxidoreductase